MNSRTRAALGAAALLTVLATAACAPDSADPGPTAAAPGPSDIDVDTPELRTLKEQARIEPCRPGAGTDGPLGPLVLPCLGGGPSVNLASLSGPALLNIWYAGCQPCKKEMPVLQEFHERYGDRVQVVGVDFQDVYPGVAIKWARRAGATYPQLADPGGELNELEELRPITQAPAFVWIRPDGEVAQTVGGVESLAEMVELVEQQLGVAL